MSRPEPSIAVVPDWPQAAEAVVRAALVAGTLSAPGDQLPFVAATEIVGRAPAQS